MYNIFIFGICVFLKNVRTGQKDTGKVVECSDKPTQAYPRLLENLTTNQIYFSVKFNFIYTAPNHRKKPSQGTLHEETQ